MTDSDGNILWQNDVTPFGEETGESGFLERDGFYTGKKIDPDTGLYYFNARWYDPELGRFITEDPIKDGLNWYAYVANNPLRYTDPTGLRLTEDLTEDDNRSHNAHKWDEAVKRTKADREDPRGYEFRKEQKAKAREFAITMTGGTIAGSAWDIGEAGYYASQGDKASAILAMAGIVVPEVVEKGVKIGFDAATPAIKGIVDAVASKLDEAADIITDSNRLLPENVVPPKRGDINWPDDDGFLPGTKESITLNPGTRVDRYGYDTGSFVSPEGVPYDMRSLPAGSENLPYSSFEVKEPITIQAGKAGPWFGQRGMGTQYMLPDSVENLLGTKLTR